LLCQKSTALSWVQFLLSAVLCHDEVTKIKVKRAKLLTISVRDIEVAAGVQVVTR